MSWQVLGRTELRKLGVPLLSPVTSGEALVQFATRHSVAVVVVALWFWAEAETLPDRYLRAVRTRIPHAKIAILSDDVHHLRLLLMEREEAKSRGSAAKDVRGAALARAAEMKKAETRAYYYADHVLTISEQDKCNTRHSSLSRGTASPPNPSPEPT